MEATYNFYGQVATSELIHERKGLIWSTIVSPKQCLFFINVSTILQPICNSLIKGSNINIARKNQ